MRLACALLGLLLMRLAARLYAVAEWLLRGASPVPDLPWRSAMLIGVVAARIAAASCAW